MASRNRVTYQCEAAYVGPAIISGVTDNGPVEVLERVQSIDYSIEIPRADVSQLGKDGLVGAPIIEHPYVEGSISYILGSFRNEKSIGLNFNSHSTNVPDSLDDTFSTSLISGFHNKENRSLDRRNFYISLAEEGVDVVNNVDGITSVVGFSKCYLNNWSSKGSVNGLISNTIGFTSCDIQYFNSTGTIQMPEINFKRVKDLDTKTVVLPTYEATGTSALFPRDIDLSITSLTNLDKVGAKFSDIKLQEFDLDLSLQRRSVNSLGYRIPLDQEIVDPSMVTLSLNGLVGESATGSLFSIINDDQRYDVEMDLYSVTGCSPTERGKALTNKYILKKAKVERFSYGSSIGENKIVSLGFSVDLDPSDLNKGFFLSGFVNT